MRFVKQVLSATKDWAIRNYANFSAWKSDRQFIIFESDDWGGMRMPNPATLQTLLKTGLKVDDVSFNRLDGLEKKQDLELLLEVLDRHRDHRGNPAKFTCNMVLGNPDFEAIERNGFTEFVRESMFDSYQRYNGEDLKPLWNEAISKGLVQPQFHCREHLNSGLWIRDLRAGQPETKLCFQHRFFGLRTKTSSPVQKHYLAAYSAENEQELSEIQRITCDGLGRFEAMFGFRSKTFVACNYVLPIELERTLADGGVEGIQTRIKQTIPSISKQGQRTHVRRFTGQRSSAGPRYMVRNALFEPYQNQHTDWVTLGLKEVSQAFRWRVPAIVSSHRINYTSAMSVAHRDLNLNGLGQFLTRVLKRWPNVEFISSDELVALMNNQR